MLNFLCLIATGLQQPQNMAVMNSGKVAGGAQAYMEIDVSPATSKARIEIKQLSGPRVKLPKAVFIPAGQRSTVVYFQTPELDRVKQISVLLKLGNETMDIDFTVTPTLVPIATGVGNGKIALDWEAVQGAVHYDVFELTKSGTSVRLLNDGTAVHSVPGVANRRRFVANGSKAKMGTPRTFRIVANRPGRPLSSAVATATSTEFDLPFASKNPQDVIDKARENFLKRAPKGSTPPASLSIIAPDGSTYIQTPATRGPAIRVRTVTSPQGTAAITDEGETLNSFPNI